MIKGSSNEYLFELLSDDKTYFLQESVARVTPNGLRAQTGLFEVFA